RRADRRADRRDGLPRAGQPVARRRRGGGDPGRGGQRQGNPAGPDGRAGARRPLARGVPARRLRARAGLIGIRALTLHARDSWPTLAMVVILGFPVAGFLIQVGRVRRARLAASGAGGPAPGRIRILLGPDLAGHQRQADVAEAARSSLADSLGAAAAGWGVDFGPPPAAPRVVVEIATPGGTPARLARAPRARIAPAPPADPDRLHLPQAPTPA